MGSAVVASLTARSATRKEELSPLLSIYSGIIFGLGLGSVFQGAVAAAAEWFFGSFNSAIGGSVCLSYVRPRCSLNGRGARSLPRLRVFGARSSATSRGRDCAAPRSLTPLRSAADPQDS